MLNRLLNLSGTRSSSPQALPGDGVGRGNEAVTKLDKRQRFEDLFFFRSKLNRVVFRSIFPKCQRQMGISQHVCHSFEVVGHDCEAELGVSSCPSAQKKAWMTEDTVLDGCEGMLDDGSAEPHRSCRRTSIHSG